MDCGFVLGNANADDVTSRADSKDYEPVIASANDVTSHTADEPMVASAGTGDVTSRTPDEPMVASANDVTSRTADEPMVASANDVTSRTPDEPMVASANDVTSPVMHQSDGGIVSTVPLFPVNLHSFLCVYMHLCSLL